MADEIPVPDTRAGFEELLRFAQTYNGYALHGGLSGLRAFLGAAWGEREAVEELPDDVDLLRACLFFEHRQHYFSGGMYVFETEPKVVALLERIRAVAGETVPRRDAKCASARSG
ncbi:hypothetical protein [Dactylosporangium sp. CS-033363]|uniref:hypothetical protein n=1 Tax=Dactylosporangium sp. CS-033363 TaxID=3239935 RepID=UPI003D8C06FE